MTDEAKMDMFLFTGKFKPTPEEMAKLNRLKLGTDEYRPVCSICQNDEGKRCIRIEIPSSKDFPLGAVFESTTEEFLEWPVEYVLQQFKPKSSQ